MRDVHWMQAHGLPPRFAYPTATGRNRGPTRRCRTSASGQPLHDRSGGRSVKSIRACTWSLPQPMLTVLVTTLPCPSGTRQSRSGTAPVHSSPCIRSGPPPPRRCPWGATVPWAFFDSARASRTPASATRRRRRPGRCALVATERRSRSRTRRTRMQPGSRTLPGQATHRSGEDSERAIAMADVYAELAHVAIIRETAHRHDEK